MSEVDFAEMTVQENVLQSEIFLTSWKLMYIIIHFYITILNCPLVFPHFPCPEIFYGVFILYHNITRAGAGRLSLEMCLKVSVCSVLYLAITYPLLKCESRIFKKLVFVCTNDDVVQANPNIVDPLNVCVWKHPF